MDTFTSLLKAIVIVEGGSMHRVPGMLSGTECWGCALDDVNSFLLHFLMQGIFSLPQEIDSQAWWLEFIKGLVDASPPPHCRELAWRVGHLNKPLHPACWCRCFLGVPGQRACTPSPNSWRVVCIVLTHFEEQKAVFPLENTRERGVRRLAVKEDALHMGACWLCLEAYSSARNPGEVLAERLKLGVVRRCHFWCEMTGRQGA